MAASRYCPSCLSATSILPIFRAEMRSPSIAANFLQQQIRTAASSSGKSANAAKGKRKDQPGAGGKKKKVRNTYLTPSVKDMLQFPLLDAMRYLRAAEAGRSARASKYELHVRLSGLKNGPVVRNRIRLPHPVKTDLRICVIAPSTGPIAEKALAKGASIVGEEEVFEAIKAGKIDFDRCICHTDSLPKLGKSGVARILGPRGLMPSVKQGTVVKDVVNVLEQMAGSAEYRERVGVVRLAIGQLGFTPQELAENIRTFMQKMRMDLAGLQDQINKEVHEVVLSSTNGPGMSLNGDFRTDYSIPTKDLTTS